MKLPVRAEYHQHYPTCVLRDASDRIVATFERIEDAREAEDALNHTTDAEENFNTELAVLEDKIEALEEVCDDYEQRSVRIRGED